MVVQYSKNTRSKISRNFPKMFTLDGFLMISARVYSELFVAQVLL